MRNQSELARVRPGTGKFAANRKDLVNLGLLANNFAREAFSHKNSVLLEEPFKLKFPTCTKHLAVYMSPTW